MQYEVEAMAGSPSDEMVVKEPMKGLRCTSAGDTCGRTEGRGGEVRGRCGKRREEGGNGRVGKEVEGGKVGRERGLTWGSVLMMSRMPARNS
jgi:hypothetical protein